ncbi:Putative uncharacterized transposon-derived protein F54H12.3 [Araneus ventricosus]|uniref:Uncharacterized transposon-derived protein F54H12.3 n=1 Tax=Araneus ventricosus TaxID=182803 RepID=A0A4Y2IVG4_ARAVE|nr:Putative uncharacterized transposon-derived protein F54H12.3 [Araneus ventricosus]
MADKFLEKFYKNLEEPASFSGTNALGRAVGKKVKTKDIKKWLESKDSYTLHRSARRNFKRNRVIVGGIDEQFQADLLDMQFASKFNSGYKYLLTCIDVFSKFAWAIPLKDKSGQSILNGFKKIFTERKPQVLQTDKGTEFKNSLVQNYLKKMKVHFFTTNNETKASIVERFHRTLMSKLTRYFTEYNTRKYIDVIEELIYSYNHTWHRSIKIEPSSVNIDNQAEVWQNLYGDLSEQKSEKPSFKVGDTVRISKWKGKFEKGYENNWSREIFTVHKIVPRIPTVYKLQDFNNNVIEGTFYETEMQKVVDSGYYPVERVIKKRKRKGKLEYFVKFQGYPDEFNSWVSEVKML